MSGTAGPRNTPSCRHRAVVLAACGVLALAGCAPMRWHKANGSDEATGKDAAECREDAHSRSWQEAFLNGMHVPRVVVDPIGRTIVSQPMYNESDRFLAENELMSRCMQRLGYELKRVEPDISKKP